MKSINLPFGWRMFWGKVRWVSMSANKIFYEIKFTRYGFHMKTLAFKMKEEKHDRTRNAK